MLGQVEADYNDDKLYILLKVVKMVSMIPVLQMVVQMTEVQMTEAILVAIQK